MPVELFNRRIEREEPVRRPRYGRYIMAALLISSVVAFWVFAGLGFLSLIGVIGGSDANCPAVSGQITDKRTLNSPQADDGCKLAGSSADVAPD